MQKWDSKRLWRWITISLTVKSNSLKKGAPTTLKLPTSPNGYEGQDEGQAVHYESH
jgi:hypothetical protein